MTTGNDEQFENLVNKFAGEVELDENKNVDEQEDQKELAGKFGVFGYSKNDVNTWCSHYDTEEESKAAAVELAQELNSKDLVYVEVWHADEEGRFGVSGEPIWRREYGEEPSEGRSPVQGDDEAKQIKKLSEEGMLKYERGPALRRHTYSSSSGEGSSEKYEEKARKEAEKKEESRKIDEIGRREVAQTRTISDLARKDHPKELKDVASELDVSEEDVIAGLATEYSKQGSELGFLGKLKYSAQLRDWIGKNLNTEVLSWVPEKAKGSEG